MIKRRVFVVVLDGVGAGEAPDAAEYGDIGSSTLLHVSEAVGGINLPTLQRMGLGNIFQNAFQTGVASFEGVPPSESPLASFGRLQETSPGKDSITGHWEMMGIVLKEPLPTYPAGFPVEIVESIEREAGTRFIGNVASSGTEILVRLGAEHVASGFPILYTSADSVFQIAAHEEIVPLDHLYYICETARRLLIGRHGVGRVIARPFVGFAPNFRRTEGRRDYPLPPPFNVLDELKSADKMVHAIGKIHEFFAGRGIQTWDHTTNNVDHMSALLKAVNQSESHLIFANFEDFDMLYGHRNDPSGFAMCLEEFDLQLPLFLDALRADDLLIITSDHGNDPTTPSTDHSREFALLLVFDPAAPIGSPLGDIVGFSEIGRRVVRALGLNWYGHIVSQP